MVEIQISDWHEDFDQNLTVEMLKHRFFPASKYKVNQITYPAGENIGGLGRKVLCFVFAGSFKFKQGSAEISVKSGDWVELPAGAFELSVGSECDVEFAHVWEL